jgi:hypothetical protein
MLEASLSKCFERPHFQNNQSKMDWRRGSRGRDPTLQAGSPEFKLQSHQKKKKKIHQQLSKQMTGGRGGRFHTVGEGSYR